MHSLFIANDANDANGTNDAKSTNDTNGTSDSRLSSGMSWLEKLGFIENPFYLDPVGPDDGSIDKGFIDRQREQELIQSYAELRKYKLLVLGKTGEGKSSILNLFKNKGSKIGKLVIDLDALKIENSKEDFIESLLRGIQRNIHQLTQNQAKVLNDKLKELQIVSKTKKITEEVTSDIEGKIGAIIASIRGSLGQKESKGEEIQYYIPPRIKQLEGIYHELLPQIFESCQFMVILDNLEKLTKPGFEMFLDTIIQSIPNNLLFITTGDYDMLDQKLIKKCERTFDGFLVMDEIDTQKLEMFIEGRIKKYSRNSKPKIDISKNAIDMLFDYTGGNLRESFRLCFQALMKTKSGLDEKAIQEVTVEAYIPKLRALGILDKKILKILSERGDASIQEIKKNLDIEIGLRRLYSRCESLTIAKIIMRRHKRIGKRKPVSHYYLPAFLKPVCSSL